MVQIVFEDTDGAVQEVKACAGQTLMEVALHHCIEGIEAECGGACSCATCHVYVDSEWTDRLGRPNGLESGMLEMVSDLQPGSRLSCQITVTGELEGLRVKLPANQG